MGNNLLAKIVEKISKKYSISEEKIWQILRGDNNE